MFFLIWKTFRRTPWFLKKIFFSPCSKFYFVLGGSPPWSQQMLFWGQKDTQKKYDKTKITFVPKISFAVLLPPSRTFWSSNYPRMCSKRSTSKDFNVQRKVKQKNLNKKKIFFFLATKSWKLDYSWLQKGVRCCPIMLIQP